MQAIQYTSNRCHVNNKYTNKINIYKYVIRRICLQLWIILGKQCSSYVKLEANNRRNLVYSAFICNMPPYPYLQHFCRTPPNLEFVSFNR